MKPSFYLLEQTRLDFFNYSTEDRLFNSNLNTPTVKFKLCSNIKHIVRTEFKLQSKFRLLEKSILRHLCFGAYSFV